MWPLRSDPTQRTVAAVNWVIPQIKAPQNRMRERVLKAFDT